MKILDKLWKIIYLVLVIAPWAIGGLFATMYITIVLAIHLPTVEALSYDWWVNILLILLTITHIHLDMGWQDELIKEGWIKNAKDKKNAAFAVAIE